MTFRTRAVTGIALAAISGVLMSKQVIAGTATAQIITYTANGTFASVPTSGADTLKLAGQPFTVSIAVSAATVPFKTGPNWAAYNRLKLTGSVHSALLGPTPVNIASNQASIIQAFPPTSMTCSLSSARFTPSAWLWCDEPTWPSWAAGPDFPQASRLHVILQLGKGARDRRKALIVRKR